jgi:UDP-N-acetylglucosamine 2-epimerase
MKSIELNLPIRKALFVVSSTAQSVMFKSIIDQLTDWDIAVINSEKYNKKQEIESVLHRLGVNHSTISRADLSGIKEVLSNETPNIVVVGHDRNILDRLFIKCANSRAIPTLLVQDGILAASRKKSRETGSLGISLRFLINLPFNALSLMISGNYSLDQKIGKAMIWLKYGTLGRPGVYGHGECKKIAVFGTAVKETLISEGVDAEKIVVTGNPKFDQLYHSMNVDCKEIVCEKWDIPSDKKLIILLTQYFVECKIWSSEQRKHFVTAIANASAKLPNTQLIIKLHPPHENEEDYNEIVKDLPTNPIICKYVSLPELLNVCSIAITVSSTAALEAMALGKQIVIVDLFDNADASYYKGSGALYIRTEEEILPVLQKALYNSEVREDMKKSMDTYVYEQAYLMDGRASERIANLIRDMVLAK